MWGPQIRYSQLTRWCKGNASALGARCPGFNPGLRQGFLCLNFVLLLFCFFSHNFAMSFAMLIYVVYITYCNICG